MLGGSAHEHISEAKQTYKLYKEENDIQDERPDYSSKTA